MALINKFPLLEELELSLCSDLSDQNVFDVKTKLQHSLADNEVREISLYVYQN